MYIRDNKDDITLTSFDKEGVTVYLMGFIVKMPKKLNWFYRMMFRMLLGIKIVNKEEV